MRFFTTKVLPFSLLFATTMHIKAQDIHFAQYYSYAASLNPALIGNYDGSFRASVLYRNQWGSPLGKSAFSTVGADIDVSLLEGYLKDDKLGIGVSFFNDRSGQAGLSVLNAALSAAYHKGFGKYNQHRLSLGAQGAFIQKRLDDPLFGDQFRGHNQAVQNASAENFQNGVYNFDFNCGLYWRSMINDRARLSAGFSVYHLLEPKEGMIDTDNPDYKLPRRFTGDLGVEVYFKKKFSIQPEFLFMQQGQSREIMPGMFFGYYFNTGFRNNSSIHVGARYRVGDAAVIMGQVEFRNVRLGFAYDVNTSSLNTSTRYRGAYEFCLTYVGESIKSFKANKSLPSRRF